MLLINREKPTVPLFVVHPANRNGVLARLARSAVLTRLATRFDQRLFELAPLEEAARIRPEPKELGPDLGEGHPLRAPLHEPLLKDPIN